MNDAPLPALTSPPLTLFRSDDLIVRSVPVEGDGDRVVVTFESYTDNRSLDRPGFGEAFLTAYGASAIHVICRDNVWYQLPELGAALAVVAKATRGTRRVMTYGTSMGGYAAVRFADRVGAQVALALSPQYSIDPAKTPFETRWRPAASRIRFMPELDGPIRSHARTIVGYDPTSVDGRHVEMIEADIPTDRLRVHYAGHSAPALLQEAGLLKDLVFSALDDTVDIGLIERTLRDKRRTSSIYYSELAYRQRPERARFAIDLARRAAELNPTNDIPLKALALRLAKVGEYPEAIRLFDRMLDLSYRNVDHLMPFSRLLEAGGEVGRAIDLGVEALARTPPTVGNLNWVARLLRREGRYREALGLGLQSLGIRVRQPGVRKLGLLLSPRP